MAEPQILPRELHIDGLKLIAAQLIVLHHFSAYGPLSVALQGMMPDLWSWLFDDARKSVQIFLVIGGYLAARSLAPDGQLKAGSNVKRIINRYLRLVLPYLAALAVTTLCAALTRKVLNDPFIPGAAQIDQVLAHIFLLHSLLGLDALSAGVWYVAIDFQLFVLMVFLLWLGKLPAQRTTLLAPAGIAVVMLVSLFYFNRHNDWDNWALYFFGAYGLGAWAYWSSRSRQAVVCFTLIVMLALAALGLEYRDRIALALAVAVFLAAVPCWSLSHELQKKLNLPLQPVVNTVQVLGRSSYALFLIHFAVLMLCNALFARLQAEGFLTTAPGVFVFLLGSLVACTALALLFERRVEQPLNQRVRL